MLAAGERLSAWPEIGYQTGREGKESAFSLPQVALVFPPEGRKSASSAAHTARKGSWMTSGWSQGENADGRSQKH